MNNPSSTLGIGNKLVENLDRLKPSNVLLVFGNVDLHINFIYQLQTKGDDARNPDAFQELVFNQYTSFIENSIFKRMIRDNAEQNSGYIRRLLISSVIMPVVENEHLELSIAKYTENDRQVDQSTSNRLDSVSNILAKRKGCDLESRRLMINKFNESLEDWCGKNSNVHYIDINKYIIESDTVKEQFRDKDPTNIHILWEPTIKFWLDEISNQGIKVDKAHIVVDLQASARSYATEKQERMKTNPYTSKYVKNK